MPARLTVLCHAPTAATRVAAFPLDEPIELSLEGGARVASGLGKFATVLVGEERRTQDTAGTLSLGNVVIDPLLRDIDLGRWAGHTFKEIEKAEPDALMAWLSDPASKPHDGESVAELLARAAEWLARLDKKKGRVLAITHPAVVRALIAVVVGASAECFWRIDAGPLARADFRANGARWVFRSLFTAEE